MTKKMELAALMRPQRTFRVESTNELLNSAETLDSPGKSDTRANFSSNEKLSTKRMNCAAKLIY